MSIFEYEAAEAVQSFAYEIRGDSAVILRCFSRDTRAKLPERIGDHPVTELGSYAFSEHFDEEKLEREIQAGRAKLYVPEFLKIAPGQAEKTDDAEDAAVERRDENTLSSGRSGGRTGKFTLPPALRGERLEEIILPPTIRRVGRYCFYNCGSLRRIEFHGELSDWGSGAFTGCHGVRSLRVYTDENGCSHLKDVLDELREELEVECFLETVPVGRPAKRLESIADERMTMEYRKEALRESQPTESSESVATERTDGVHGFARLIFPEFYEEGVENTPARILENHVHGSGILYRNCFRGRALDFAQYDALFPHARAWESGELVLRMALARLRAPQGLTRKAKERYETYLSEHAVEAGSWLLGQRDLEGLRFLLALIRSREDDGMKIKAPRASGAGVFAGSQEDDRRRTEASYTSGSGAFAGSREHDRRRTEASCASGAGVSAGEWEDDKKKTEHQMSLSMQGQLLRALLEEASRAQYMEAVSYLMEYEREHRTTCPSHRRRLEL